MKTCHFCSSPITKSQDCYEQVTAWVLGSKRDSATLRESQDPPRYAHRSCIVLRQLGTIQGQEVLIP